MRWLPAVLILAIAQTAIAQKPPAADFSGRLFFTPEQRAQLDVLRTQRVVATKVREEPVPEFVTYSGIVRRSDGKATVWVNGELLTEAELRNKQSIVGSVGRDGRVRLQTPQATGTTQVQLKVGQSAELLSGRIDESYTVAPVGREPAVPTKTAPAQGGSAASAPSAQSGGPVDRKDAGEAGPKAVSR
ncbi:MAG: hypothetical protein OEV67_09190 [Betaproteobacteria bacterium]|jgi:hypothetical protein|nr:hypothetical protein [Betaproteobacteria bacterium]